MSDTYLGHNVLHDDHLVGVHVDLELGRRPLGVLHRPQKVPEVVEVQLDEVAGHLHLKRRGESQNVGGQISQNFAANTAHTPFAEKLRVLVQSYVPGTQGSSSRKS